MPRASIFAIASLLLGACAARPAPLPAPERACSVDAVAWLVGSWVSTAGDETTVERWTRAADRLVGEGTTTRDGARVFGERLEIACAGGALVYTAWPEGQAMAAFRATSVDETRAVFEEPSHDFPTRIEYRRDGEGLVAEVSGEVEGAPRVESWTFAPQPER